jgi:hypothetical protein
MRLEPDSVLLILLVIHNFHRLDSSPVEQPSNQRLRKLKDRIELNGFELIEMACECSECSPYSESHKEALAAEVNRLPFFFYDDELMDQIVAEIQKLRYPPLTLFERRETASDVLRAMGLLSDERIAEIIEEKFP